MLYDFKGAPGYTGPEGDISLSFISGEIEGYDDEGEVTETKSLLESINNCAKA